MTAHEIKNKIKENEDQEFKDLLHRMWEIRQAKRQDYNAGGVNNFEMSKFMGVDPWMGIMIRISDKFSRCCSFARKGFNAVEDESIEDTLLDMANYCLLCILEYRKGKK